ncbi:hypothetical protein LINPERPRIM_LOCUS20393 [Linum perenne]
MWCCHPDEMHWPSIRQVISVLKMEAALPSLPAKLPVPMYYVPPLNITKFGCNMTLSGNIRAGKTSFGEVVGNEAAAARKPMIGRGRPRKLGEEIGGIRGRWVLCIKLIM